MTGFECLRCGSRQYEGLGEPGQSEGSWRVRCDHCACIHEYNPETGDHIAKPKEKN
jgi:hypothetical protein